MNQPNFLMLRPYEARRHFIIIAFYLVIALGMTYPLIFQFGDHVPGSETWAFDEYTFLWNFWWFKHAVFDLGVNPFYTNFTFYPIGVSLVLYTYTLLNAILAIPIEFAFGYAAASNALLIFAFVMAAYGTFLLTRYLLTHPERTQETRGDSSVIDLAGFIAGIAFAFTSSRFVYSALGHYNFVSSQYVPFYAFFFIKAVRGESTKNAVLAGIFGALAILIDTTYAVFLALFSLLYLFFAWRQQEFTRKIFIQLAVLVTVAGILAAPLLVPAISELTTAGYALPSWGHAEKLLVDLFGLLTPTSLHPLNRNWVGELDLVRQGTFRFVDVNTVFLGYLTLGLAILGAWLYRKRLRIWIASAVTFAILSLGPLLHINGQSLFDFDGLQVTFPLPFLLLHYIPFLKENRVPNRFGILVTLALAVLIAFAVSWILTRVLRNVHPLLRLTFSILLAFLLLFEHLAAPLPLSDARVPEVYRQIAQEPGDFAILTLPLGWRNSFTTLGAEDTRTQFYQSVHGKYLVSGNTSRNPPLLFDYFDRISLFHSLTQIELYHEIAPNVLARDKAEASNLASFFDIRYVVINAATPGRLPYSDTRNAVMDYVEKVLPLGEKIYDRDGVVAYRLNRAPPLSKLQVDFGTEAAHLYQAEGWDRDESIADSLANWANRQNARLVFPAQVADYQMTLRLLPFTYPQAPTQTIELFVNGQTIRRLEIKPGWENYSVTLPARVLHSGLNDVTLEFAYLVRPRDVLPPNFAIGATGAASPVDLVVNSGDLGSIKVDGREASPLGRGYNVVVIDPSRGAVVNAKTFNTADDRAQSRAMADFIEKIPNGFIVAVASQEEAAANLGDHTVMVLRSIGAQIDIRKNPNGRHAIIGVKGAAPGAALEQSNEGAAFISVGHSPDERTLAVAVSSMTIEKK